MRGKKNLLAANYLKFKYQFFVREVQPRAIFFNCFGLDILGGGGPCGPIYGVPQNKIFLL